jgi:hypothetical protein
MLLFIYGRFHHKFWYCTDPLDPEARWKSYYSIGNSNAIHRFSLASPMQISDSYFRSVSFIVLKIYHLSQFTILVWTFHQAMTNRRTTFYMHCKTTFSMEQNFVIYMPWLCNGAWDNTNFSIIFVSQSLKLLHKWIFNHDVCRNFFECSLCTNSDIVFCTINLTLTPWQAADLIPWWACFGIFTHSNPLRIAGSEVKPHDFIAS